MQRTYSGPRYLMRWDHTHARRLGRDVLQTPHRLAELPMFSDEGLAAILDQYPREALCVNTMGENPAHPNQLRTGLLGAHSGIELLRMVRYGRIRLRLRNIVQHHRELDGVVQRLCGEMMECQPGLRTSAHDGDLEIASPGALTYYRYDVNPVVFWQIRGQRNVWVYPTHAPFVHTTTLEETIIAGRHRHVYFEPAFDDHALQVRHGNGAALALPQHRPYRVVNGDTLSVTLTTKFQTPESRIQNEIHCANRMLKRFLPVFGQSTRTSGYQAVVKRVLLRAMKQPACAPIAEPEISFRLEPDAPLCVAPLNATAEVPDAASPLFPTVTFDTSTSATVVTGI